jgi:hypothetical protein
MSIDRTAPIDDRMQSWRFICLLTPKLRKPSKLEAEQERHTRCITSTRQTHKVFRFSISFRAQFNDHFAYICLSFLLVASFSSRKNVNYGHVSTETGLDIRRSPIMTSSMMMRKIDRSNLNLRRNGLRKKAHMLLHIAHRLVSVVIYLIRALVDYLATLTPNSTAISILSQRLCVSQVQRKLLRALESLLLISRDFHDRFLLFRLFAISFRSVRLQSATASKL